jgi:hypothetical protein
MFFPSSVGEKDYAHFVLCGLSYLVHHVVHYTYIPNLYLLSWQKDKLEGVARSKAKRVLGAKSSSCDCRGCVSRNLDFITSYPAIGLVQFRFVQCV